MEYSKFKVVEFVTDEYFLRWIKKPDVETNAFWTVWLSKNVGQFGRVRKAREMVLYLNFKINPPPEGRFLAVWEKIIKAGLEQQCGRFSRDSKYDPPAKILDVLNACRFYNWKLPTRKKGLAANFHNLIY